jgi:hypothetical protein
MIRAHQLENNVVVNTILVDSLDYLPNLIDGSIGNIGWEYINGVLIEPSLPEKTPEQLRAEVKAERDHAVANIKVTTSTGKTFDGDETSQTRMSRAILGMQAANASTITWVLSDNTLADVTIAELSEALAKAGAEQARLWVIQ